MPADVPMEPGDAIAIVGIGGQFAGSATPERFWSNLVVGTDATSDVPSGRWLIDPAEALDRRIALADHVYSTRGGFAASPRFDPTGTGLDANLLNRLDPVFHLALSVACQAWSDARIAEVDRLRAGVIFGNIVLPTETVSSSVRGPGWSSSSGWPTRSATGTTSMGSWPESVCPTTSTATCSPRMPRDSSVPCGRLTSRQAGELVTWT